MSMGPTLGVMETMDGSLLPSTTAHTRQAFRTHLSYTADFKPKPTGMFRVRKCSEIAP